MSTVLELFHIVSLFFSACSSDHGLFILICMHFTGDKTDAHRVSNLLTVMLLVHGRVSN